MLAEELLMTNTILSDRGMGCCNSCCLGFLRGPDKPTNAIDRLANRFSRDCTVTPCSEEPDDDDDDRFHGDSGSFYGQRDRAIYRGVPVKETGRVWRGRHASGKKMINEYTMERKIGCGSYGKVGLYRSNISGKQYAIKTFSKSRLMRVRVALAETAMMDVLREVSIMKTLEHPNIVNLIEVIDDPESDQFYMVLEYVDGERICDPSGSPGGIGERSARRYLRDMISGLMYLHAHNIVHGDIKPENILVTRSGRVKIADFSVSHAFQDDNDELWRSPGTPLFTAPECCLGFSYHGKAADTWAIGITLYCMVLGHCPFIGDSLQDAYDKIVSDPLSLPAELDPELKDLLGGLLCKDPMQRITLDAVAQHSWVVREGGPVPRTSCKCKGSNFRSGNCVRAQPDFVDSFNLE
ncbi:serine/threonine-protein kinase GRIK1-like [Magnolia sinica]|uniref:serine/threonine-protein kinase GRIK1-like n=1 Tax=Magnolia sinica TaxID=86752 RepID=UPI0026590F91|nr:serine/threonine-protein kinase GRIK1-like [Magnolia sinica]